MTVVFESAISWLQLKELARHEKALLAVPEINSMELFYLVYTLLYAVFILEKLSRGGGGGKIEIFDL